MLTSQTNPIQIDFLPNEAVPLRGSLGLCEAPGRVDRDAASPCERDLEVDLTRMASFYYVSLLVCLLERGQFVEDEMERLQIPELLLQAREHGIKTEWCPLPSGDLSFSIEPLMLVVDVILQQLKKGHTVVLCCRDGVSRSGVLAAGILVALGASQAEAVEYVREIRPGTLDTPAQFAALRRFDTQWRRHLIARASEADLASAFASTSRDPKAGLIRSASVRFEGTIDALGLPQPPGESAPGTQLDPGAEFQLRPGRSLVCGSDEESDIPLHGTRAREAVLALVAATDERLLVADLADAGTASWERTPAHPAPVELVDPGETFVIASRYRFRYLGFG
ncbi:MAG: hypothetical protein AAGA56_08370 [Myxococcota bacterium]